MNARHTHELILDSSFREAVVESSTNPDVLRMLMLKRLEHSECIHYVAETGHARAVPVELRRSNGRKVPVSVARAVYVATYAEDLGPDDDVKHTCGAEYVDLDGIRRPCINPTHLVADVQ